MEWANRGMAEWALVNTTSHTHTHSVSVVPGWRTLMFGVSARCWGSSSATSLSQRMNSLTSCPCWMRPWSAHTSWSWQLPSTFSSACASLCLLSVWRPWSEYMCRCWPPVGACPERWGSLPFATYRSVRMIHICSERVSKYVSYSTKKCVDWYIPSQSSLATHQKCVMVSACVLIYCKCRHRGIIFQGCLHTCPCHFREHNTWGEPGENFFKFGTNFHLVSRMNWIWLSESLWAHRSCFSS